MSIPLFSNEWAVSWCTALNDSPTYRESAKKWKGAILFCIIEGDQKDRAILLDLKEGRCKASRIATQEDWQEAPFIIEGPLKAWKDLLERKADPLMSLVSGKLTLTRGSLVQLMPYVKASKELLEAAVTIDTLLPE